MVIVIVDIVIVAIVIVAIVIAVVIAIYRDRGGVSGRTVVTSLPCQRPLGGGASLGGVGVSEVRHELTLGLCLGCDLHHPLLVTCKGSYGDGRG